MHRFGKYIDVINFLTPDKEQYTATSLNFVILTQTGRVDTTTQYQQSTEQ